MPDLALGNKIQHGCNLIREKKTCSLSQSPCNAESLKFSSRKFCRKSVHPVGFYSQLFNQFRICPVSLFDYIFHAKSRIYRLLRVLPDHLYRTVCAILFKRFAVKKYLAALRRFVSGQDLTQSCFSKAAGRYDSHTFTAVRTQAELTQYLSAFFLIPKGQVSDLKFHNMHLTYPLPETFHGISP